MGGEKALVRLAIHNIALQSKLTKVVTTNSPIYPSWLYKQTYFSHTQKCGIVALQLGQPLCNGASRKAVSNGGSKTAAMVISG